MEDKVLPYITVTLEHKFEKRTFQLDQNKPFKTLMELFAKSKAMPLTSLRFLFDGERMREEDTPLKFEMVDGDLIDVFEEQTGGGWMKIVTTLF